MCMRMGSDAGRDFLSTRDPVKKEPRSDEIAGTNKAPAVERPVSIAGILEQYFMRGNRK